MLLLLMDGPGLELLVSPGRRQLGARQALDPADPSLSREQARLSREQADLGRKQAVLEQEQVGLGRQPAELPKQVERTVGRLIDGLIQSGKARELTD